MTGSPASVPDGSGQLSKSVAGAVDVTLTATEAANGNIELTGAITANINVIVPTTRRMWRFYNSTTGAFTLTVKTAAGTGVAVTQGSSALLESNGTNVVAISTGGSAPVPVLQLNYNYTGNANGTALAELVWTEFVANQNFTVDSASSLVEISVQGIINIGAGANGISARVVIDSAGTPQNKLVGGNYAAAGNYANVLAGSGKIYITGLSAAVHTVKLQIQAQVAASYYCATTTYPDAYFCRIQVVEHK